MSQYYLMSQLPSLDAVSDSVPVPITEERFCELCNSFLDKNALEKFNKLTLLPPTQSQKTGSVLIDAWNEGERMLRLALSKLRAQKQKKPYNASISSFPITLLQTAKTAVEMEDPMKAELFLNSYRLNFLESLRPMDNFADDSVFYYGIKLKLILRIRQFDELSGQTAYRNIYNSIMNGERREAVQ